jgi:hypothetical protein
LNSQEILIHSRKVAGTDFTAVIQSCSVSLRIATGKNMDGEFVMFDMSGRLLTRKRLNLKEGMQVITVQVPMIRAKQVVVSVICGMDKISRIVEVK